MFGKVEADKSSGTFEKVETDRDSGMFDEINVLAITHLQQ